MEEERGHMRKTQKQLFRDTMLFCFFFVGAIAICNVLSFIYDDNNQFAVPVFILAVSLIALCTNGYLFGILASLLGVLCVNVVFTYPYWQFHLAIAGYPLTFAVMLVVSICISTLTTRLKKEQHLRSIAEMEKMRANLLRSVSHDLRTPLTSIIGSSSVLLEKNNLSTEECKELLQEINKDACWLNRITENILSVTKFTGNQIRLHKEYEVIEEIVSSAIVKFHNNHPSIHVSVQKPEEILLAPMDATLIEQVLLNLFDNAAVHGKTTNSIVVSISSNGEMVYLEISDNGSGIDNRIFPHLFDGWASSYISKPDDHRNMGIGLSVCQSILRAHGGCITARNIINGGACFTISLPTEEEYHHE